LPLVFPVHPRTAKQISQHLHGALGNLLFIDPLGYFDFMKLVAHSRIVLTDSGGIQEETTALGVPCLTLRSTTERPVTVDVGTNLLVGSDPNNIVPMWRKALDATRLEYHMPEMWDGHAARRIVGVLLKQPVEVMKAAS
jgi:UDP-N-acetylglucosamine 2-epimerase (non-hydrolysing)